jgi:indolepyruvate ferredoxin oxidoreductase beta subunit
MNKNIVLCGVGGQGTILASKLIASAAMGKGLSVMSAETIGMAQRGGNVFSNLRIGKDLTSAMIKKGTADIILAFEPGEAVRMLPFLKKDGAVVVNKKPVKPTTATLSNTPYRGEEMIAYLQKQVSHLTVVDGETICQELGSPKVLNVVLLGAALQTGILGISKEDILNAMKKLVKPEYIAFNEKALCYSLQE